MTARVAVEHGRLKIQRTGAARWLGTPVDVPLVHVCVVHAADPRDVMGWNKSVRLAGIQIPGLMTSGIYRQDWQLTWWDVGRGTNAIVITFRDERLARAIVEVVDPTSLIRTLDRAITALPAGAVGR